MFCTSGPYENANYLNADWSDLRGFQFFGIASVLRGDISFGDLSFIFQSVKDTRTIMARASTGWCRFLYVSVHVPGSGKRGWGV